MFQRTPMAALCALTLMAAPALAQDMRYTLQETDDGYVRMDTETGQISTCVIEGDQMVCRMAADDRAAFEADVAALEDRITALEEQMAAGGSAESGLPSEDEFERTLNYMERFFRSFRDIVEDFGDEEPAPDRT